MTKVRGCLKEGRCKEGRPHMSIVEEVAFGGRGMTDKRRGWSNGGKVEGRGRAGAGR